MFLLSILWRIYHFVRFVTFSLLCLDVFVNDKVLFGVMQSGLGKSVDAVFHDNTEL